ncbi:hypothetical protein IFM89_003269, partial [Coptis chinensis]
FPKKTKTKPWLISLNPKSYLLIILMIVTINGFITSVKEEIVPQLGDLNKSYKSANANLKTGAMTLRFNGRVVLDHYRAMIIDPILGNRTVVIGILYKIGRPEAFLSELEKDIKSISDNQKEINVGIVDPRHIKAHGGKHGINCLELQRIAVKVLSQTCSSYGCDHNRVRRPGSIEKTLNHLAQRSLSDLIYVRYNLHLRERQLRRKTDNGFTFESVLFESLLDDGTREREKEAPSRKMRLEDLWMNDNQIASLDDLDLALAGSRDKLTTTYVEHNPCVRFFIRHIGFYKRFTFMDCILNVRVVP